MTETSDSPGRLRRRRRRERRMRFDPRLPVDRRYGERGRRAPRLVTAECPRCGFKFGTKYGFGVHICRCGWFHKIEPLPSYGHVDGKVAVSVDCVMQTDEPGWEERGDPPNEKRREAVRKVLEHWRRRNDAGGFDEMRDLLTEAERIELLGD